MTYQLIRFIIAKEKQTGEEVDKLPFVTVYYKESVPWSVIKDLSERLTEEVSRALNCNDPGGKLTVYDIEVEIRLFSEISRHGDYDLEIIVDANDYPERRHNLKQRTTELAERLSLLKSYDLKFYVWIRLMTAEFVEVSKRE